jgi:hypothetical protein
MTEKIWTAGKPYDVYVIGALLAFAALNVLVALTLLCFA